MRRLWKILAAALAALLIAVTVIATITVRRPFPDVSGTVALAGVRTDVDVVRDKNGIVQIYADSSEDLFFAQGYVHAQDRFFEMDFRRHVTSGRLAELVGTAAIDTDKYTRTLGWRRVAEEEVRELDSRTRAFLQAYADGVNAYIGGKSASSLSLEYAVLAVSGPAYTPEPWEIADSVAWVKAMAWDLRSNMDDELERSLASAELTKSQIAELFPGFDRTPIVESSGRLESDDGLNASSVAESGSAPASRVRQALATLETVKDAAQALPALLGTGEGIGSNSWVVSGDLTASGQPLLANDPHLGQSIPGVWHQAGLHCREKSSRCPFDVTGFTFSGIPGVVIGHNDKVAWGVTTMYADVTDLYLERIEGDTYLYEGEYLPLKEREETIEVAGAEPVTITVRSTRHGPLLSDLDDDAAQAGATLAEGSDRHRPFGVSLKWTALEPQQTIRAVFLLAQAEDWKDMKRAAEAFTVPSQNFVYADVEGNIGYIAPGRIPQRKKGDGTWPVPGWDRDYEWGPMIPFDELPKVFNPPEGYIVTANQPVIGEEYPHLIGHAGAYGFRSDRIHELLEGRDDLTVADMTAIQTDALNVFARELVPRLVDFRLGSSYYMDGLRLLEEWDFQQTTDSAATAYFNEFWRQLLEKTFSDELGSTPPGGDRWMQVVLNIWEDADSHWWDDKSTPLVRETRDQIVVSALRDSRDELTRRQSRIASRWKWGDQHELLLRNATLGSSGVGVIEALFNRGPEPVAGGTAIVNANGWDAAEGFGVVTVPSMRMVVDLANFDRSRWIQLTGNSGHAFHRNYTDQFELWLEGKTLSWPFSRRAVDDSQENRMVLRSARSPIDDR